MAFVVLGLPGVIANATHRTARRAYPSTGSQIGKVLAAQTAAAGLSITSLILKLRQSLMAAELMSSSAARIAAIAGAA